MPDLAELRTIVGDDHVREAGQEDSIDGARPALVVRPGTVEEVSGIVARADRAGWRVAPRGGGSKLDWGAPPTGVELVLDLRRLDRVIDHAAGDLVAHFQAGVPIERAQGELAAAGQMLALDPPHQGATIGGVIAANASGPRRLRYGTVRDLLIGATVVLADGTIAKTGGKVVKNVAGYDLCKLMTGSLGTLGVIVQAIFRLHPRLPARRLVEVRAGSAAAVSAAVQSLLHSTLVPSAIQLAWPDGGEPRVGVLFEGTEPGVVTQAATAAELLRETGEVSVRAEEEVDEPWAKLARPAPDAGAAELKVGCLPSDLGPTLEALRGGASRRGLRLDLVGAVANGVLHAWLEGDPGAVADTVREVRGALRVGSAVLLSAPLEVKRRADVWGPVGDSLPLMRRVKDQYDPQHILNPGRFVGGI